MSTLCQYCCHSCPSASHTHFVCFVVHSYHLMNIGNNDVSALNWQVQSLCSQLVTVLGVVGYSPVMASVAILVRETQQRTSAILLRASDPMEANTHVIRSFPVLPFAIHDVIALLVDGESVLPNAVRQFVSLCNKSEDVAPKEERVGRGEVIRAGFFAENTKLGWSPLTSISFDTEFARKM